MSSRLSLRLHDDTLPLRHSSPASPLITAVAWWSVHRALSTPPVGASPNCSCVVVVAVQLTGRFFKMLLGAAIVVVVAVVVAVVVVVVPATTFKQVKTYVKSFPSHMAHRVALISISIALSQLVT